MSDELTSPDGPTVTPRPAIAAYFATVVTTKGSRGPIGELAVFLSAGVLEPTVFATHVQRHGVAKEVWFRRQLLDLALGFIEQGMAEGSLTGGYLADARALNAYLGIRDGDFVELRPAEVAAILGAQLSRILEDAEVTDTEELYQVELQAAFGLGYDDYLELTRGAFERACLDLRLQAGGSGPQALEAKRKLKALEPVYWLAAAQRRTPGALY